MQVMFKKAPLNVIYKGEIVTKTLALPLVKELNMTIMLPDENIDMGTLEKELTSEKFIEWMRPEMMDKQEVEVFLPRFKLEENYNMKDVLC